VSTDRLTRNELTWLLTQEARSAAQKLRQGVGITITGDAIPPPPPDEGSGGVETTLNRLDEAVSALASLHGQPTPRGRRGKIDLAALLWEVAPDARVQIEMGEGTTVFGDEAELRRMLHVLLGQSGDPTSAKGRPDVAIRREGDVVKVGVNLGPDKPPTFETERAWLSRMATRYGGRLVLDGSMQTLILPADVDMQRQELESLKKELAAAQAQGEAYARELAAVFSRVDSSIPSAAGASPSGSLSAPIPDALPLLVAAVRGLGPSLRGILAAIGRDIAPLRDRADEQGEIAASVARHVTAASEIVGDLARLGACPLNELPRILDVADVVKEAAHEITLRAARHDVRVVVESAHAEALAPHGTLTVLIHSLIDHAIQASPPGTQVAIGVSDQGGGLVVLTVDDAGPALSERAKHGVLSRDFEALAHGRPSGLSLIAAHAIAAHAHLPLEFEEGPHGGARVRLTLSRSIEPAPG
jgi:signal transduction histidine kinase